MGIGWWVGFNAFVLMMLAADLGVFHRKAHEVTMREAATWSFVWFALALSFGVGLHYLVGREAGLEFLAGYLIEKSLSVDNIFVFMMIFSAWNVPREYQHRVLFWGVLGALVMRGVMIFAGAALITRFEWIIYPFGAFLLVIALRMLTVKPQEITRESMIARLVRRAVPVTDTYEGQRFTVKRQATNGMRRHATPLLIVLMLIEGTDLIFALDSIPAIFAVTRDPFIVYTSNIFAILGLRSLYFLLDGLVHRFRFLTPGVALVLVFVGVKMLLSDLYHIPVEVSLAVIASALTAAIIASIVLPVRTATVDGPG